MRGQEGGRPALGVLRKIYKKLGRSQSRRRDDGVGIGVAL
jgi:hypothetical protein